MRSQREAPYPSPGKAGIESEAYSISFPPSDSILNQKCPWAKTLKTDMIAGCFMQG
jgi:hypothetical protein